MCPKLFIHKEFYFLILKSNMGPHHKHTYKWVIKYKNKKSRINKSCKKKNASQNFFLKNMDNLHFIPDNILTIFFKS